VARGARLAVQVDRDVRVAAADFGHEAVQAAQCRGGILVGLEFLVVDRQDEAGGAALLLRERSQVAVAGVADDVHAFGLDGGGQLADAGAAGVLAAEIFVDDDDREVKTHT